MADKTIHSTELRLRLATVLEDVNNGDHIRITHYGRPTGVLVPDDWYDHVTNDLTPEA